MRIVFLNPDQSHRYDVDTPWERALSGTDSAQVFLAMALAKRGHEVFLLTGAASGGKKRGVTCLNFAEGLFCLAEAGAVFVTCAPYTMDKLAQLAPDDAALFAWEHNPWNPDPTYAGALQGLSGQNTRILCVSHWHKEHFARHGVDSGRILVLRNAVAPYFLERFESQEAILAAKASPPELVFTSTPYLGLSAALDLFARCREARPELTLKVFSSFAMYSPANAHRAAPKWQALYDRARSQPGVEYFGNVPQPELRRHLRRGAILFYPNVLRETSSICTMEAMASGCKVVAPPFGALPETLAGHGEPVEADRAGGTFSARDFVQRTLALCERFGRKEAELERELREQMDFVRREYCWERRAEQAERLIDKVRSP